MKHRTLQAITATILFAVASLVLAQRAPQTPPSHAGSEPMMHRQPANQTQKHREPVLRKHPARMQNGLMGTHAMPGTVTSVDHATGIVKLKSAGMILRVHFPPPTITKLRKGDRISLHLAYKMIGQKGEH